jgi:hypothetical protein
VEQVERFRGDKGEGIYGKKRKITKMKMKVERRKMIKMILWKMS